MRNWNEIRRRHYVRLATSENYWLDFSAGRVRYYRSLYGDDFCLVINGSETDDDAYVLPYAVVRAALTDDAIDHRGRWSGRIDGSTLTLAGKRFEVGSYHNAFRLLDSVEMSAAPSAAAVIEGPAGGMDVVEDAIETKFHLESDLENSLLANLDQLENGLRLYEANGMSGRQLGAGAAGRIDILATDAKGNLVVIELKAGEADRQVCGQVQAYMGWVSDQVARGRTVRGIVVAEDFTERLKLAVKVVPQLSLKAYSISFRFRDG